MVHDVCRLYSDVVVYKNLEKSRSRLEEWRNTFEGKGLRVSKCKTEYIEYYFGEREYRVDK